MQRSSGPAIIRPRCASPLCVFWFRQLRGHRVDADATFLELLAACDNPWETANEFHAVLDFPVDDGSGQPTEQDRKRARAILLRMHRAAQHAHPTRLARMLIDAKKPAWLIREARDLKCDICNSLKPDVAAKVAPVTLRATPEQWEELAMDVGEFAFEAAPHLCKIKFLLIIDKAGKFIVAPMHRQFGLKENFEPNTGHIIEAFSSRWLEDKPRRLSVVVDENSPLKCKDFKDFLSGIGILHCAISGQAHGPHGTAEGHIKTMRPTMAKLTAEFPELRPATILSLAVMGHNRGESVRGSSPFFWSGS